MEVMGSVGFGHAVEICGYCYEKEKEKEKHKFKFIGDLVRCSHPYNLSLYTYIALRDPTPLNV